MKKAKKMSVVSITGLCLACCARVGAATVQTLGAGSAVSTVNLSANGFDQLLVRCTSPNGRDPTLQALALDDLRVMLTNLPPAPVIYGSDLSVDRASGIAGLIVYDTLPGCQYRLLFKEALSTTVWTPVTPPVPDGWQAGGAVLTLTDPGATGRPHRFYRVEVR